MILEAQQITALRLVIIAEDTEHDCEIPGIHLVPLAMRCDAVEVQEDGLQSISMDGWETSDLRANKLEIRSKVSLCKGTSVRGRTMTGSRNTLTKVDSMLDSVFLRKPEQWFGKLSQVHLNACQRNQY